MNFFDVSKGEIMNNLSFTQEYFLCAVNKKGDIPFLSSNVTASCLVAGGIMELSKHGFIARDDKKKIIVTKSWDNSMPYLAPLYETIASFKKNKKIQAVIEAFALSVSDKKLKELVAAIRSTLLDEECLNEINEQGLIKEKRKYVPKPEIVTAIIEKIRKEFLTDGKITKDVLCLSILLVESNLIKNYFSKVEVVKMKDRIKEVRNSDEYSSVKEIFDYMDAVSAMVVIIASN